MTAQQDKPTMPADPVTSPPGPTAGGSRTVARAATVGTAVVLALAVWAVAQALGVDLRSPRMGDDPPATIGVGMTALAALLPSLAGWGLLELLEWRWPSRATLVWSVVAGLVFVVSLAPPVTGAEIATATRVVLATLHIVVAAALTTGLLRSSPTRHRPR